MSVPQKLLQTFEDCFSTLSITTPFMSSKTCQVINKMMSLQFFHTLKQVNFDPSSGYTTYRACLHEMLLCSHY